MTEILLAALKEPLRLVTDPSARTWWPALVGGIMISVVYDLWSSRGKRGVGQGLRDVFGALWHPSSRVDLGMLFVRGFFRAAYLAVLPWTAKLLAVKTVLFSYKTLGKPPIALEGISLIIPYSICLLLASDFSRFAIHHMMHRVSFLWRFHQVHHSAEVMTPFSLYRLHPVEQFLQLLRNILVVGVTAGLFAWLSYGKASIWALYGVPGVVMIFGVLGANLRHSHSWIPYPRWLEGILISPAQHQLHHGTTLDQQTKNYGSMFAIWDRAFGSLQRSEVGRPEKFGVAPEDRIHNPRSLRSVLLEPLYRRKHYPRN